MNRYAYDDIYIGQKESFSAILTQEYVDCFRKYTQDINPLHNDDEFAKSKGYKQKVVFGMLTASYYSTLAGVYLPGENSLIHSVEVKFLKPVYIKTNFREGREGYSTRLFIEGVVVDKNDTFKLITIKAVINNEAGKKVSKAIIKAGII
ncbi:MAG: dehydratase [Elusimicrobiota bacterium]|jgi:3-hydroxybutyryl-CoA dehydratase|nr:dehydratase [Elusimicrobiota bacterium]